MARIRKAPSGGWRAEYRTPDGKKHSRTFPEGKKGAAARWLADQVSAMNKGLWTDPHAGKLTFEDWTNQWLPTKVGLRESTRARIEIALRSQLVPAIGTRSLASIQRSDVQGLVAQLIAAGQSPATFGRSTTC
jgi:hypothetical protein